MHCAFLWTAWKNCSVKLALETPASGYNARRPAIC